MREAMFIKKNAEKWKTYQHKETKNPDETAERFITLIDDLSYAKTFYPKSKVTQWVNGLAAKIYQSIYQNKKEKHQKVFLFTALVFFLFVAVGYLSSVQNPAFVRGILGDEYVNKTEDRIANGDPFGIYSEGNSFNMFILIAFNNIKVAFITFVGGFTLGIYTLKAMLL